MAGALFVGDFYALLTLMIMVIPLICDEVSVENVDDKW